jgi:predicted nucleic acid-binding protein
MILVDTSIWIEFFKGNEPYFTKLKEIIESSDVLAHEVVFSELLQGCKNKTELNFNQRSETEKSKNLDIR